MSRAEDEREKAGLRRLLVGAAKTVAGARYCWLATTAEHGGTNARPMQRLPCDPSEDDWTLRFVIDGRSRKASEIRRVTRVAVVFQQDTDDAFVTLIGAATLREDTAAVRQRWKNAYNVYFPSEEDRASAAFVEIVADHLELWIRGVTPEPFGLRPTILERNASGDWRLTSGDCNAV
jgi:general stress protein 26